MDREGPVCSSPRRQTTNGHACAIVGPENTFRRIRRIVTHLVPAAPGQCWLGHPGFSAGKIVVRYASFSRLDSRRESIRSSRSRSRLSTVYTWRAIAIVPTKADPITTDQAKPRSYGCVISQCMPHANAPKTAGGRTSGERLTRIVKSQMKVARARLALDLL